MARRRVLVGSVAALVIVTASFLLGRASASPRASAESKANALLAQLTAEARGAEGGGKRSGGGGVLRWDGFGLVNGTTDTLTIVSATVRCDWADSDAITLSTGTSQTNSNYQSSYTVNFPDPAEEDVNKLTGGQNLKWGRSSWVYFATDNFPIPETDLNCRPTAFEIHFRVNGNASTEVAEVRIPPGPIGEGHSHDHRYFFVTVVATITRNGSEYEIAVANQTTIHKAGYSSLTLDTAEAESLKAKINDDD